MELTPEIEAHLRAVAARRGLSPDQATAMFQAEQEEMLAGLRASEEDHEAGRSMTLDEYRAGAMARRQARGAAKDDE